MTALGGNLVSTSGFSLLDGLGVAALVVSVSALYASWRIGRAANDRASLNAFFLLVQRYESRAIASARRRLLEARKARQEPDEALITTVLNAFEHIAVITKRRVVDEEVVWAWIGDRAVAFWWAFQGKISAWQQDDETYYEDYRWLIKRLREISREHGSLTHDEPVEAQWIDRVLDIDLAETQLGLGDE